VLRGGAGTLLGRLVSLLATGHTPSARTDNWLYAYSEVINALELAGRLVRLATAVAAGLNPDREVLGEQLVSQFTAAADLAEALTQHFGLDYRTAYRVVGRAVAVAVDRGEVLLPVTAELLTAATDPVRAVMARDAPGGASPRRVREHALGVQRRVEAARCWNIDRRAGIAQAETALLEAARNLTPP
jgi:argininosuccinate lyase